MLGASGEGGGEAAEYSSQGLPAGWYTKDEVRAQWFEGRTGNCEDMRASSCACRRKNMDGAKKTAANEPFALLHRG